MGFSLGGLLAGAMKGIGEGYSTVAAGELENQRKLEYQDKLLQMQEEKEKRIAEHQADVDIGKKKREVTEVEPLKTTAEVDRTRRVGTAESDVLVDREDKLRPGKVKSAAEIRRADADVDTETTISRGTDPKYLRAKQGLTDAGESSATKTTAAAASFKLTQEKALADLRGKLSKTEKGSPERESLTQQIADLSGGSTKSYADMVTAGDAFRKLASNLRQQLKDDPMLSDAEQKDIRERITAYESQAASILGTTVDKRLGGGASAPKAGASSSVVKKPEAPKPWERDWANLK